MASTKKIRRLGLLGHGFTGWAGGVDFLRGIATGLHHADPSLEMHVLAPTCGPLIKVRDLRDKVMRIVGRQNMGAHRPGMVHIEQALAGTSAVLHHIDLGPRALARAVHRLKLDALLPAMAPQPIDAIPWVGYIFDFQHKHLPQFFTSEERTRRDFEFARMLNSASAVVVNARDVVKDIEFFYPDRKAKVFAMPFAPAPAADWFDIDPLNAQARYGIKSRYFIICNQFWKHKDHGTAFKAFARLAVRHPELLLVCTGATSDHRFPGYFDELMRDAAAAGVAERVRTLGLIPKPDQLALLRGAVALVQPTLFEGGPGGGAVFDAVAVGQRCLISDIPVNTEINEPTVTFFKAGNPESLAECMQAMLAEKPTPPKDPTELIALGVQRRQACGRVLLQAVDFVHAA